MIAMIASPLVNWLEKKFNIVKKLGSALVVILVLALIVLILYFSISKLVTETISLLENIPQLYKELEAGLDQIGNSLQGIFHRLPPQFQEGWDNILLNMDQKVGTFITKISEPTVAAAGNFAKKVPSFLISIIVAIMSAYLFTVEHEEVLVWAKKTAPPSVVKRMTLVSDNLKYAVGGYLKAQIKIMGIVFLILWVGLSLLQVHYAVLIAIAIAFLDFLPFFGTGTAMIPWVPGRKYKYGSSTVDCLCDHPVSASADPAAHAGQEYGLKSAGNVDSSVSRISAWWSDRNDRGGSVWYDPDQYDRSRRV